MLGSQPDYLFCTALIPHYQCASDDLRLVWPPSRANLFRDLKRKNPGHVVIAVVAALSDMCACNGPRRGQVNMKKSERGRAALSSLT